MTPLKTSSDHPYDRLSLPARAALTVFVCTLVGMVLAYLSNGSPAAETAKRMTARAYMPLMTSAYPATGRDRITVLAMDDDDLEYLGLNWPVPMDYYQRLIDKLVALKPKAIFIDILFLDDRPQELVKRFKKAACDARDAGVPVYLASLEGQRRVSRTMALLAATDKGQESCFIFVAPNLLDDHFDHSTWEYPVKQTLPTAAFALACSEDRQACREPGNESMALLWPATGHPINPALHLRTDANNEMVPSCVNQVAWFDLVPVLPKMIRELLRGGPQQPLCPYNLQMPVRALSGAGMSETERTEAIRSKYVLLGTAFQSSGDRVISPLGQNLIGVHVHALALDNLISLKGDYRRGGDFDFHELASPASKFTLSALLLIGVGNFLWHCFTWGSSRGLARPAAMAPSTTSPGLIGRALGSLNRRLSRWFRQGDLDQLQGLWWCLVFGLKLAGLAVLFVLTLGNWPARPDPDAPPFWQRAARAMLAAALFIAGMGSVFLLGDVHFRVGPLSVIEFLLFPLGVDFLDRGNVLARYVAVFLDAGRQSDPVDALKDWLRGAENT